MTRIPDQIEPAFAMHPVLLRLLLLDHRGFADFALPGNSCLAVLFVVPLLVVAALALAWLAVAWLAAPWLADPSAVLLESEPIAAVLLGK